MISGCQCAVISSAKPMCNGLPGMQVRVVNSYAAASLSVSVTLFSKEDFPTEGKPVMMSDDE